MQYIFAKDWPLKAYFSVAVMLGVCVAIRACHPSVAMFSDWLYLALFAFSIVVAPVLALFLSLPFVWMVVGPLYYVRGRLNGAPFQVGDTVCVLVGPHRGRITRVYSHWQGNTLRVKLGKEEEDTYKDVFSPTQLVREKDAEPGAPPNGGPATPLGNSGVTEGPPSVS